MKEKIFILLQYLLPQHLLSRLAGKLAASPISKNLIPGFVHLYKVNMSEAQEPSIHGYTNFHDFFTRKIQPESRPIAHSAFVSPCDGTIADIGRIQNGRLIQAKKHYFTVREISGCDQVLDTFTNGHYMTIYLSPKDYHRVHIPCSATLIRWRYIPGKLFSVNMATAKNIPKLYARNERLVCHFQSHTGQFLLIMVGAMMVSGIVTPWHGKHILGQDSDWIKEHIPFDRLDEIGQFCFGSTVVLMTEYMENGWAQMLDVQKPIQLGQSLK